MDGDHAPAIKLKPLERKFCQSEQEWEIKKQKWEDFIHRNQNIIINIDELHYKLSNWSYCSEGWANSNSTNLRDDWQPVLKLIIDRNIEILGEWYENLKIENLKVQSDQNPFGTILDLTKWRIESSGEAKNDDYFDNEETVFTTETIELNGTAFFFYIYISTPLSMLLTENAIKFGLKVTDGPVFFNIKNVYSDYRIVNDQQAIEKSITLLSKSEMSLTSLKLTIQEFLESIPLLNVNSNDLKNKLSGTFT